MVTWTSKICPRCHGNIFIDRDMDGWYEQCLQCSYRCELEKITEFKEQNLRSELRKSTVMSTKNEE